MNVLLWCIQELKKNNVKVVARCCDPTYSTDSLTEEGIRVVVCQIIVYDTS